MLGTPRLLCLDVLQNGLTPSSVESHWADVVSGAVLIADRVRPLAQRHRDALSPQAVRVSRPLRVQTGVVAKTIQVRDVPDDVHRRLTVRAAEERRSLSELICAELVEIARRPTMSEMLDRLAGRPVLEVPESSADALAGERLRD